MSGYGELRLSAGARSACATYGRRHNPDYDKRVEADKVRRDDLLQ